MYLTVNKLKTVLSKGYDINTFISDRAGRKSSVCQEFFIEQARKGKPFALIREKVDESITANWLSEYVRKKYKSFVFWNEKIDTYIGAIFFKESPESEDVKLLCYTFYLSVAKKYKSNYFEDFEKIAYIVWEECIPNQRIVQDVQYISTKLMNELIAIMSIGSTIARGRKIQFIFLGNDIKVNLINPITISFNLLERLTANCEIVDKCVIDDREYQFYFNYFDFDGAVNHWLINTDMNIDNTINIKDKDRYLYILITNFDKYYIYNCGKYNYITNIKNDRVIDTINDEVQFFDQYGATHLLESYELSIALNMLMTFYDVSYSEISTYFGEYWEYYKPKFKKLKNTKECHIVNISELSGMTNSQLLNISNFNQVTKLVNLLKSKPLIASNIQVLIYIKELSLKLAGLT